MGRKSPKRYEKMGWHEKQQFNDDMMEKYGIDRIKTQQNEITGRGGYDSEAEGRAIARAMANDYDTRRSIELAQESGNKKAQALGSGISNISEAVDAERFMSKTHYKKLDAGGSYNGANDEGNVTNFWKDKAFSKRESSLDGRFDALKAEQVPEQAMSEPSAPVELSARAKAANSLGDYSFNATEKRGFAGNDLAYDPNAGVKTNKASSFMNDYKGDIMKGISKDGTPGRGPNSIHNKF